MATLTRNSATTSAIALLLFCTVSGSSVLAQAVSEPAVATVEAQIENQVSDAIRGEVSRAAKQHQWPTEQAEMLLRLPSGSHRMEKCASPLKIERTDRRRYPAGRLRFTVSCHQPTTWQLTVQADVSITVPVAFAVRTLRKDEIVTADDIVLKPTDIASINREFFATSQDFIGLRALRQIRRDQQLSPSHLSPAYLVSAGDKVIIQADNGHFSANMSGIALEGGYSGQQIRVRNTSSGKVIKAAIAKPGLVTTLF
ncbi:flagellar basal body P-ring formation protein FlgA [Photobacterium sp. ZSDE20]|uniref:Flagella basal body P-ring formation protein FlgA n=1 Tax=Photobacterium pectinilyticum TaxID=2906793 RepID=A0ABT1MY51_9GAMM|nr:flagellar basal body P-ring formation chaperone FlgA [Photobacterium sp. ZSDE20]MCQ1057423.1 flagellar basal body P-ring formation chaperone FlgA [Photobacterium sp. ZSDE20]MDD1821628.1 flagellar basal body P-ring formation protein FlgA [Photobacterium sp. ZSDE20]